MILILVLIMHFNPGQSTIYDNVGGQRSTVISNDIEDNAGDVGLYFYDQYNLDKR